MRGARIGAMRRPLVLGLVVALAAGACSGDNDDDAGGARVTTTTSSRAPRTTTSVSVAPTTSPPSTTTVPECDPGAAPTAAVTGGDRSTFGLLRDLVVDVDGCLDIVRFDFDGAIPGFSVEYQEGPFTEDGSGEPVTLDGAAFVVVRLEPAYSYDYENAAPTYTGPREIKPSGQNYVREVENTGDFEAVMTWIVGLSTETEVAATVDGDSLLVGFGRRG